jgi:RNA polymerase sigma factor (sigma-70 family)
MNPFGRHGCNCDHKQELRHVFAPRAVYDISSSRFGILKGLTMNDTLSEAELLQASAAGSRDAFGIVVRRYQTLVCAVTYSMTGDIGVSEELAQETFLRAWRNLRQLEDPGKFRAWLCMIARNLAHTSLRASRKAAAQPLERAGLSAAEPEPDEAALAKERQEIVWAAVERVPLQYREPLVLFYRRQQSVSEVAADLGLPEETVRQRLHRGRQLIKGEVSSLVEDTLTRSGPGQAFAAAVLAALPAALTPPAGAAVAGIAAQGAPAAKTLTTAGWAGAVLGTTLGPILAACAGLFYAGRMIKNTRSPRARRLLIAGTLLVGMAPVAFVGAPLVLLSVGAIPAWSYWLCFAAFFLVVGALIYGVKTRLRRIQVSDGTCPARENEPVRATSSVIRGIFGGCILAATIWLLIFAWLTRNLASVAGILAFDILLFVMVTAVVPRDPKRYWSAVTLTVGTLAAVMLAIVLLRGTAWADAYRQPPAYSPVNGVRAWSVNLIVLSLYAALVLAVVWRYAVSRKHGNGPQS